MTNSTDKVDLAAVLAVLQELRKDNPARTDHGHKGWNQALFTAERYIREMREKAGRPSPVARKSDPVTAKNGAKRIEPNRNTLKAVVLEAMRVSNSWITYEDLQQKVGFGGDPGRRLRELHDAGWVQRRDRDGHVEYRYLPTVTLDEQSDRMIS